MTDADGTTDVAIHAAARRLRVAPLLIWACGIMFGFALLTTSLANWNLTRELHDARGEIETNRSENACRAEISSRLDVLDSEINFHGWQGLVALYIANDRAEAARQADIITGLEVDREAAAEDRIDIVELCDRADPLTP